jgi:hypothetical protein
MLKTKQSLPTPPAGISLPVASPALKPVVAEAAVQGVAARQASP